VQDGVLAITLPVSLQAQFFRLKTVPDSLNLARNDLVPGDYATAGVGLLGSGTNGTATGTLHLSGVPTNSQVIAAYLYWATLGDAPQGVFGGNTITGTLLGTATSPCSILPQITLYRADVSNLVPTNWPGESDFTVQLPDSGNPTVAPSTEGASLVVIYQFNGLPLKSVSLYEGPFTLSSTDQVFQVSFTDFT
jgi:hypothetical protein